MKRVQTAVAVVVGIAMVGAVAFFAWMQRTSAQEVEPLAYTVSLHPDLFMGRLSVAGVPRGDRVYAYFVRDLDGDQIPDLACRKTHFLSEDPTQTVTVNSRDGRVLGEYRDGEDSTIVIHNMFSLGRPACLSLRGPQGEKCLAMEPCGSAASASGPSAPSYKIEGRHYEVLKRGYDSVTVRDLESGEVLFDSRLAEQRAAGNKHANWGEAIWASGALARGSLFLFGDRPRELRFHPEIELIEYDPVDVYSLGAEGTIADEMAEKGRVRFLGIQGDEFVEVELRQGVAPVIRRLMIERNPDQQSTAARYVEGRIQVVQAAVVDGIQELRVKNPGMEGFVSTKIPVSEFDLATNRRRLRPFLISDLNGDEVPETLVAIWGLLAGDASWWLVDGATGEVMPR